VKEELNPTIVTIVLVVIGLVIAIAVYFAFFRQGPAPDITKIHGKPPPGWHIPAGRQGPPPPSAPVGGDKGTN
jgi:hypothetical protein